jgi:hypothetical protein
MPTLPTNEDGSLRQFTATEYAAMNIRRRGVNGEGDHIQCDLGPDGSGCTRRYFCTWAERFNAAIYFVGAVKMYSTSGGAKISRLLPQRDPAFSNWIATKVRISPFRYTGTIDDTGEEPGANAPTKEAMPEFTLAALDVTYEMVPFILQSDAAITSEKHRYVTWPGYPGADVSADASYIGLPGSTLRYATSDGTRGAAGPAGVPIPYPVGFVEGSSKFKVIWRRIPEQAWAPGTPLNEQVIGSADVPGMIGSLNKFGFDGYPPLSLQLLGIEQRLLPDPTGIGYSWDLGYLFAHAPKKFGHLGYYYHAVSPPSPPASPPPPTIPSGYYQVLRQSGGQTTKAAASIDDTDSLFRVTDFDDLFNVS